MLELRFYYGTEKHLEKIAKSNPQMMNFILKKISDLRCDPLLNGFKKLKGYNSLYRVRVRDYRIVYEFNSESLIVIVIDIRSRVYQVLDRKIGHLKKIV